MKTSLLKRIAMTSAAVFAALTPSMSFADAQPPAFVSTDAVFWLDASATDTLTIDENNQVTRWNSRVGSNYARQNTSYNLALPTYDTASYGFPTVDFGPALTGSTAAKDLQFDQVNSIRTVFWVTKIERSQHAFWLGYSSDYPFSRGGSGQWASSYGHEKFSKFWCGTDEVASMTGEYAPARFMVVAAEMKEGGASANSIGCDRGNNRAGGKQLSELIVFTRTLSDEERTAVTQYLQQKWLPAEESETEQFIAQNASFWLDAAARTTMTIDGSGQVTSWGSRVGGNVAATYKSVNKTFTAPAYDTTTYGIPTVDFGDTGSGKDLKFDILSDIRTVFWVTKIKKSEAAFLLAAEGPDPVCYHFHRGGSGQYCANYQNMAEQFYNGTNAVNMTADAPDPTRFQLIVAKMKSGTTANTLTNDRYKNGVSDRNGGKQLSELIVFEKELTDEQRIAVTKYLQKKWILPEGATEEYIRDNASLWLDASATDTMNINENKEVTRWYSRTMDGKSAYQSNFREYDWSGSFWFNKIYGYPTYDAITHGMPTVDFGAVSTEHDLQFTGITDIRTVLMVVKIAKSQSAFWLGHSGYKMTYAFHRGSNGQYYDATNSKISKMWNGTDLVQATDTPSDAKFHVIAMETSEAVTANSITRDRMETNRFGGKQLSELIIFNSTLSDEKREEIIAYLQAKWAPKTAEQFIRQNAAFWLDAAAKDTLTIDENNQVSRWNSRVGSNYARQNGSMALPAYDATSYGFPTVDFGNTGSNKDLAFTQITGIRMVFMATKIVNNGNAFWLGDGSNYYFHRGEQGQYAVRWSDGNGSKFSKVWNGTSEVNMLTAYPDATKHNVVCMQMSVDAKASTITKDRTQSGRNGGKQLSELIVFTKDLSDEERIMVTEYLQAKWGASEFQWETRMAMETPDDGEWRSDLYRVFGADASVPELGANSAGVGFSADATLDGGRLSLGLAGFYAADGATATIAAPIISDVRVFGPGTVVFDPAQALSELYVSTNSTVVLKPGASVTGDAIFRKGAKIAIDPTGCDYDNAGPVSFNSISKPDDDTLTVDLSAFEKSALKAMAKSETQVLTWSAKPQNVSFAPDAQTARKGLRFSKTDSGLKLVSSSGFVVIIR